MLSVPLLLGMGASPFANDSRLETFRKLGLIDIDTVQSSPPTLRLDDAPASIGELYQHFGVSTLQELCVTKIEGLVGLRTCLPILESAQEVVSQTASPFNVSLQPPCGIARTGKVHVGGAFTSLQDF